MTYASFEGISLVSVIFEKAYMSSINVSKLYFSLPQVLGSPAFTSLLDVYLALVPQVATTKSIIFSASNPISTSSASYISNPDAEKIYALAKVATNDLYMTQGDDHVAIIGTTEHKIGPLMLNKYTSQLKKVNYIMKEKGIDDIPPHSRLLYRCHD